MSHPFLSSEEALTTDASAFDPHNLREVDRLFQGTASLLEAAQHALSLVQGKLEEDFHLDPAAAEEYAVIVQGVRQLAVRADEAHNAFKTAHHDDFERIDNPQPHADKLDIAANRE